LLLFELSNSRLGGSADTALTEIVLEQLRDRGLARRSKDGVSVPLHPTVRTFVLVVLSQLLRAPAEAAGYALQPTSTRPQMLQVLLEALQMLHCRLTGHVVTFDLEQVTLDLSPIPLDEVLDFRSQHGTEYRAYARNLRQFVRDLAALDQDGRDQAFSDRRNPSRTLPTSYVAWPAPRGVVPWPPSALVSSEAPQSLDGMEPLEVGDAGAAHQRPRPLDP
jgi:hypothetical protein